MHKEAAFDIDFAVSYYADEVRNMFSNYSKTIHSQDKVSANDASGPKKKQVGGALHAPKMFTDESETEWRNKQWA